MISAPNHRIRKPISHITSQHTSHSTHVTHHTSTAMSMSAKHTHTPSIRHIQTLSHTCFDVIFSVVDIRICSTDDEGLHSVHSAHSVVLIVGGIHGSISVYNAALSHKAQGLQFTLRNGFQAHANCINGLHFHHHKRLFVSNSAGQVVKVWSFNDITTPRLIQCLPHPHSIRSAKYSQSGLILTCGDNLLRVYGKEPLFSLCWSFQTSGYIYSVGWSPSNRICASFPSGNYGVVQVWDSSFQNIFKLQQNRVCVWDGLVFGSNDLLMSSSGANRVYWYHISKPKVMKVFLEKDVLPFCRDVMKIIIQYLPFDTRVTHDELPSTVGPVVALSSEVVGAQCADHMLRLYTVYGNEPHLLARIPHKDCTSLATCVYPCSGKETVCILASSDGTDVIVSVITSQVWLM